MGPLHLDNKAYISADDAQAIWVAVGVCLLAQLRDSMQALDWWDDFDFRGYRSHLEKMSLGRLYARTNAGFLLKVNATLVALAFSNTHL
jgi:hypothetical protein